VDVGIGEDISFSTSLITRYGCTVHGFDPTPRAIEYVRRLAPEHFVLHEYGVAAEPGTATFYLPNDSRHVSGSLQPARHLGATRIEVRLAGMRDVFDLVGAPRIDLLKIDIEGAEYGLLDSDAFRDSASRIDRLCVEFHHRWPEFGSRATLDAVAGLGRLGFRCAWRSKSTNEEFLFVRPANA
jgi:FkbM family methyltransferase